MKSIDVLCICEPSYDDNMQLFIKLIIRDERSFYELFSFVKLEIFVCFNFECCKEYFICTQIIHSTAEYEVIEKPTLSTWMQGGLDHIMLQYLNIDGIRIIGSVLGQSIALDYYVRQVLRHHLTSVYRVNTLFRNIAQKIFFFSQVDGMVAEFTDINRGMEKTGTFTMESKKLFQLVGKANSNLADVILRLGLFER